MREQTDASAVSDETTKEKTGCRSTGKAGNAEIRKENSKRSDGYVTRLSALYIETVSNCDQIT